VLQARACVGAGPQRGNRPYRCNLRREVSFLPERLFVADFLLDFWAGLARFFVLVFFVTLRVLP
jgi:hypothetical protein